MVDRTKIERQIALEEEALGMGRTKFLDNVADHIRKGSASELSACQRMLTESFGELEHFITLFKNAKKGGKHAHIVPLIEPLTSQEIAYIALKTTFNEAITPQPIQRVAVTLGTHIEDLIEYKRFREAMPSYVQAIEDNFKTRHSRHRRKVLMLAKRRKDIVDIGWDESTKCLIGLKMLDLICEHTGLIVKENKYNPKTKRNELSTVSLSEEAQKFFTDYNSKMAGLSPVFLPMIIPPKPWTSLYNGGFYNPLKSRKFKLIRTRNKKVFECQTDMPEVYRTINALQDTPWKINKQVFEVANTLWETKNTLGVLPDPDGMPIPPKPWADDDEFKRLKETNPELVRAWKREACNVYQQNECATSKRYAASFCLWVANKFKDEDEIYFVYYLDWRGRIYPIQPYVNPQADDLGKALIHFANGKRLGADGIYWLAVHGANCYGIDKLSFDDRVAWVHAHEAEILASAADPYTNKFWTQTDENPFMFLAFCFEWAGVKVMGEDFVSHLPVNMDGSCNGLQHFSALLRDPVGAVKTNLIDQPKPNDIYSDIRDKTIELNNANLGSDEEYSHGRTKGEMAALWNGKIDRQLVKRPAMTTPYGVTKRGIQGQLLSEVKKREAERKQRGEGQFIDDDVQIAIRYLAELVESAIEQTVMASKLVKDWLKSVSKVFTKAGLPVVWRTPTGFTVRQEEFQQKSICLNTVFGKVRLQLSLAQDTGKLDPSKQTNGISPNFVHSMDASHLVKTVNACLDAGIKHFSMIHDSFGCHAADVSVLHQVLRQTFVQMYSEAQLDSLYRQLLAQLPEELRSELPKPPQMLSMDITQILQATYFFG